jgi:hypothetical protein
MPMKGRNKARLSPSLVEVFGRDIGGGDRPPPACANKASKQPPENHGVGDVGDGEFVETEQPGLVGEIGGDGGDRVLALHLRRPSSGLTPGEDAGVNVGHEGQKMGATLAARPRPCLKNRSPSAWSCRGRPRPRCKGRAAPRPCARRRTASPAHRIWRRAGRDRARRAGRRACAPPLPARRRAPAGRRAPVRDSG